MALSFEFKRKSLENIIENLLCYKCKAVSGPDEKQKNRYVCTNNAHQLCEECKSRCDCGSEVGKFPNLLVHQILKDLPTYCQHYMSGCREMFVQATDLADHQLDCVFRDVYCPDFSCQNNHRQIVFKDIADHFIADHESKSRLNTKGKLIQSNVSYVFMLRLKSQTTKKNWLKKMSLCNLDFFLSGMFENDILYFWVHILGSCFDAKNYAYTLSLTGKNGYKSTIREHVRPLDEAARDIIAEKYVFIIGGEFIKKLLEENQEWPIEITIHALKEEVKDKDEESGVEDETD